MKSIPASETRRGPTAATAPIQAFGSALMLKELPAGVIGYAWGQSTRDRAEAERLHNLPRGAEGYSPAAWGDSPHHWDPALGIDVFPILPGGVVSNNPADYQQIVETAEEFGLQSGGAWSDYPHVQERNWRSKTAAPTPRARTATMILPLGLFAAWWLSR